MHMYMREHMPAWMQVCTYARELVHTCMAVRMYTRACKHASITARVMADAGKHAWVRMCTCTRIPRSLAGTFRYPSVPHVNRSQRV